MDGTNNSPQKTKWMIAGIILVIIVLAVIAIVQATHSARTHNLSSNQPATATAATTASGTTKPMEYSQATFHTSMGDFTIAFDPQLAPNTVANFVKLASSGFYDKVKFHRIIAGFMIQGGDPLSKDDAKQSLWGTGGPGYQFNDEITSASKNVIGAVAMANSGPNTNGSQFFVNVANNDYLDGHYSVFAHVTSGMDIVEAMSKVKTSPLNDQPITPVVIESITLK